MAKILFASLGLSLALLPQLAPAQATPAPVVEMKIDTGTPENALKSYWAFIDQRERTVANWANNYLQSKEHALELSQRNASMADARLVYEQRADQPKPVLMFARSIQEVRLEGNNKAVIVANVKNLTPLVLNRDMTKLTRYERALVDLKARGDVYEYQLEKQADGWRVVEILKPGGGPDGATMPYYDDVQLPNAAILSQP